MSTEEAKLLRDIKASMERLSSIVGPIIPTALCTLDGWTWKLENLPERILLQRGGGSVNVFPPIIGERGWLTQCTLALSDPQVLAQFSCDNWDFSLTPQGLRAASEALLPNNALGFLSSYNPCSIIGPVYTLAWVPSQFWPYNSQVRMTVRLPSTALCSTAQMIAAQVGRHYIRDSKQFYESIFIEGQRQATGKFEVVKKRNV